MELCVLIPAKNEEETIQKTIETLYLGLKSKIDFNILVINDHSEDGTLQLLETLSRTFSNFNFLNSNMNRGVGNAIRFGLSKFNGDIVSICMADGSDSVKDILQSYYKIANEDLDCVFGSRFIPFGQVTNYPRIKLIFNRIFNRYVKWRSSYNYNDFTNIFKTYRRSSINQIMPLSSEGFSIGLEMSLKAFNNNCGIAIIPISWKQRTAGESKLKLSKNFRLYMYTLSNCLKR